MAKQNEFVKLIDMGILNPESEFGSSLLREEIYQNTIWMLSFAFVCAFLFWFSGLYNPQHLRHPIDRYRLENRRIFVRAFAWLAVIAASVFAYKLACCFCFPYSVLFDKIREFM